MQSLNGGDYISGERGMSLIVEAMEKLQIKVFLQCDDVMFRELFVKGGQLQLRTGDCQENQEYINEKVVYRNSIHS